MTSNNLDNLLDCALASLKIRGPKPLTPSSTTPDSSLRKNLPKLQTGIDADSLYLKANSQQLKTSVALADEVSNVKSKNTDGEALVQLTPAQMEDQRKPNQQEKRKQRENTSGKSWFDMPKAKITPELERDWQIIQMRNVLDPKRHYRKDKRKAPPTYCQVGTVIEGAAEFYSSRMTRRERKQTILEEFLHDTNRREYFRDRYRDFQNERAKGTRAWRKAQRNSRK